MIKLDDLTHKIKTYRFKNLNFYNIFIFFWKGLVNGSLSTRASSLAFNFFLAFFPSIIVVFTLIYTTSKCRQDLIGTKCNYAINRSKDMVFSEAICKLPDELLR